MELGIATKLSKLNGYFNNLKDIPDNTANELIELNKIITSNFHHHVIDMENIPLTNEEVLDNLKKCVLTIQSKRKDALELLDLYSSYDFTISIVLGNNHYLSKEESKLPKNVILRLINKALEVRDDIWVGIEGVESTVLNIIQERDLTAYYIYGGTCPSIIQKKVIYVPYTKCINNEVLKIMEDYLKRRKNYRGNYWDFILELDNSKKVEELKNRNKILIGYPVSNRNPLLEIDNFKEIFR